MLGGDGVPDVHVRLSGVSGIIAGIRITALDGVWETPLNQQGNWLVVSVPTTDPSTVDVFFNYFKSITSYNLAITFKDGQRQTVTTVPAGSAAPFDFSLTQNGDKSVTSGSSITNTISASLVSGSSQQISFSATGLPSGAQHLFHSLLVI